MTPDQILLVQNTWAKVVPIKETAASLFYGRLFELDPSLRPLFKTGIEEQGRKLMAMIGTAVGGLTGLDELLPAVQSLGQRHVAYGVRDKDYDTVAAALLWTLEKGLGDAWTPAVKQAWTQAYVTLAGVMKAAGAKAAA
jgi:hemoglobin-like flavoprotein